MLNYYNSGDQDSVVSFSSTRTFIRELVHDLKLEITDPYRVWFHKGQVYFCHQQFNRKAIVFQFYLLEFFK